MKVVIAPDSFKESMSAAQAAAAMERGVRHVWPDAECVLVPMADGGEGTTEAMVAALGGLLLEVDTTDALGREHRGQVGICADGTAVLEVASAVGLEAIEPALRDPLAATSRGVADLVTAALDGGAQRIVVGLGGSATNDGGAGLLVGLGARLFDENDDDVLPEPRELARVRRVDLSGLGGRVFGVVIDLACDVTNPLLGSDGASAVFGPQKGASPDDVARLDDALRNFADALEAATGREVRDVPGAGAAGGLGAAFLALGARRSRGVDLVADVVGLDGATAGADVVLTGEGSIDAQTLAGKTPAGVGEVAARHGVPVVAFAGRVAPGAQVLLEHGFLAVVPILREVVTLSEALRSGPRNLELAVADAIRLLQARV